MKSKFSGFSVDDTVRLVGRGFAKRRDTIPMLNRDLKVRDVANRSRLISFWGHDGVFPFNYKNYKIEIVKKAETPDLIISDHGSIYLMEIRTKKGLEVGKKCDGYQPYLPNAIVVEHNFLIPFLASLPFGVDYDFSSSFYAHEIDEILEDVQKAQEGED